MSIMRSLLVLATSLAAAHSMACPYNCNCTSTEIPSYTDVHNCKGEGVSVTVTYFELFRVSINIKCESSNTPCYSVPPFDDVRITGYEISMELLDCSPSILECVHIYGGLAVKEIVLHRPREPLTSQNLRNLHVLTLRIYLSDNATGLPYTTINSTAPSLKNLVLTGTNLLSANSSIRFQHLEGLYIIRDGYNMKDDELSDGPLANIPFFGDNSDVDRGCVHTLELMGNHLATVNGSGVTDDITSATIIANYSLPSLKKLVISGWKINLSSVVFAKFSNLEELSLINNSLGSLPEHGLNRFAGVQTLHIGMIYLEDISPGAFRDLSSPQEIRIHGDDRIKESTRNLTRYEELKILCLKRLSLKYLQEGTMEGLEQFQAVLITDNKVNLHLDPHAFSSLSSLSVVVLTNNKIYSLPEELFLGCDTLEEIIIDNNSIKQLPKKIFSNLINLIHLNLKNNKIAVIPDDVFMDLHKLQVLDLSENYITTLHGLQFPETNNLALLDLSHNSIASLISNAYKPILYGWYPGLDKKFSPLKSMTHLTTLNLRNNFIKKLYKGWQSDLLHIKYIDFTWNAFTSITDFNIDFSNADVTINLTENIIANVTLEPRPLPSNNTTRSKSALLLNYNPIIFDCNSYGLYQRLHGLTLPQEPNYIIDKLNTVESLEDISPSDLVCDFTSRCLCTNCTAKAVTNEVIFICTELPPTLRIDKSEYNYFKEPIITVHLSQQPQSIAGLNIHTLNLSYAGINNLTFEPTESLRILDLSHNNLGRIPDIFFNSKLSLYLSNNPLECDCEYLKNLKEKDVVDFNQITCWNGDKLAQIKHSRCNKTESPVGLIGICLAVLICVILIGKAMYHHSNDIRNCMRRILCRRQPTHAETLEMILDAEKQFDLFVSFAHDDTEFVTHSLLPKLENDFYQKVCVHMRDWIAGELISDQIIQSVENSRRTIIILTESFLSSEWSYLEFRTARNLCIQEGKPRIIIILLDEDIVNSERMKIDIKLYLSANTYIVWGDPKFWEKLENVLPKQGRQNTRRHR